MTTAHYATSYQSDNYCAAYRAGVLTIVRLRDGHSCTLNLTETNRFRVRVMNYELSTVDLDPIDRACVWYHKDMRKRKWVRAEIGGATIAFHNEPVRAET